MRGHAQKEELVGNHHEPAAHDIVHDGGHPDEQVCHREDHPSSIDHARSPSLEDSC